MNPAQPNIPNVREACFLALEQAYADSLAMQENTQKQINRLLNGFQHLEKLIQAANTPPTPPQIHLTDPTPVQAAPTRWPPPVREHLCWITTDGNEKETCCDQV